MYFKEAEYPLTIDGKPDLSFYTDPLEYYIEMFEAFARSLNRRMDITEATTEHCRRCYAVYGLIARGAEAIPYALKMLANKDAEIRQDGSAVLEELGQHPHVVEYLVTALEKETNQETIEILIAGLGRLRAKKALPVLARIIRNEDEDGETRWNAAEAVGLIARRSFVKRPDPVQAALEWLKDKV